MPIFVLKESAMNGTVTVGTTVTGVKAKTYDGACKKVKEKLEEILNREDNKQIIDYLEESSDRLAYRISNSDSPMPTIGTMNDQILKVI